MQYCLSADNQFDFILPLLLMREIPVLNERNTGVKSKGTTKYILTSTAIVL